ncbi:MAG: hypothetical protein GC150_07450 [Rhizobiales bacterium]|nr:hypothetical protein [Hyphomicrobiales bacterium]
MHYPTIHMVSGSLLALIRGESKRGPYYRAQFANVARDGAHLAPTSIFLDDQFPLEGLSEGNFVTLPVSVSTSRDGRLFMRSLGPEALRQLDYQRLTEVLQELHREAITGQRAMGV